MIAYERQRRCGFPHLLLASWMGPSPGSTGPWSLMKGGLCHPSQAHPMRDAQRPSLKLPPLEKGDGSFHPFPKPFSLSRSRRQPSVPEIAEDIRAIIFPLLVGMRDDLASSSIDQCLVVLAVRRPSPRGCGIPRSRRQPKPGPHKLPHIASMDPPAFSSVRAKPRLRHAHRAVETCFRRHTTACPVDGTRSHGRIAKAHCRR